MSHPAVEPISTQIGGEESRIDQSNLVGQIQEYDKQINVKVGIGHELVRLRGARLPDPLCRISRQRYDDLAAIHGRCVPAQLLFLGVLRQRGNKEIEITARPMATVQRSGREVRWKVGRCRGRRTASTYLNAEAEPYVRPLAEAPESNICIPCDVTVPDQLEADYARIAKDWGRLDFAQRSIAFARKEDLFGRITYCSAEGFALAMNISVQSFLRMAKLSEKLTTAGGFLLAMVYYRCGKAIARYNVMCPVKAALEAAVRYMAIEPGQMRIRVNALSPGPVVPNIAAGNMVYKNLAFMADAQIAGLVVGARVPVILTSRADTAAARHFSAAAAVRRCAGAIPPSCCPKPRSDRP